MCITENVFFGLKDGRMLAEWQDAFVQLAVSTYKDAARLVSNVGEHSAIFALLERKMCFLIW